MLSSQGSAHSGRIESCLAADDQVVGLALAAGSHRSTWRIDKYERLEIQPEQNKTNLKI